MGQNSQLSESQREEILKTLDKICESPSFCKSLRVQTFLRFVVTETLMGRAERIKAYLIGVEVFNRAAHFDASADPIVRTTATRVRLALDKYYIHKKNHAPVVISMPIGSYVPEFIFEEKKDAFHDVRKRKPALPALRDSSYSAMWRFRVHAVATTFVCAVGLLLLFAMIYRGQPTATLVSSATVRPRIVLPPVVAVPRSTDSEILAQKLNFRLVGRMADFGVATIIRAGNDRTAQRLAAAHIKTNPDDDVFLLDAEARAAAQASLVSWSLTDPHDGEIVWASTEQTTSQEDRADALVSAIASAVLGVEGALPTLLVRKHDSSDPRWCIGKAQSVVALYNDFDRRNLEKCLEGIVNKNPRNYEAQALLSLVYLWSSRNEPSLGRDPLPFATKARKLAQKAIQLAPTSLLAQKTILCAAYNDGDIILFKKIARNILENYNDSSTMKIWIGAMLINFGFYDEGEKLVDSGISKKMVLEGYELLMPAFASYAKGDFNQTVEYLDRTKIKFYYMVPLLKAAAFAKIERAGEAETQLKILLSLRPNYGEYYYSDFRNRHQPQHTIELVADGLRKAGLVIR